MLFVSVRMAYSLVLGMIQAERLTAGAVILEMMGVALRWWEELLGSATWPMEVLRERLSKVLTSGSRLGEPPPMVRPTVRLVRLVRPIVWRPSFRFGCFDSPCLFDQGGRVLVSPS
jgi:hypothetical protein